MTNILNHDNVKPVVAVATEYIVDYHQADRAVLNQLVTSSQIIAAYFNKEHKDVLESVRNILAAENSATKFKTPDVAPPEVLAQARAKTMLMNARTRQAKLWKTLADESTGTYREICKVYAANILAGKEVLPLPKPPKKTMTATELGEAVGLTAMNVGLLANKYNLKTTAFGQWVYDVLKNGRRVESFRYYESAIPVIKEIAEAEKKDRELKARVVKTSLAELLGDIIIITK